jgi:NAD(P)H-binding
MFALVEPVPSASLHVHRQPLEKLLGVLCTIDQSVERTPTWTCDRNMNATLERETQNMKIVVLGGSGLIGTKVVQILTDQGHEALAASPNSGVDATTGRGLAEALAGAQVVVDVSNSPSFEDAAVLAFFEHSGRNLARAEKEAAVRHHVALSVVGTDRLPDSGYFRAKLAQERLIKSSGIPYTIIRATQFFEFVGSIANSGADGGRVRVSNANFQPIAAADVAEGRRARSAWLACQRYDRDRGSRTGADERTGRALPQGNQRHATGRR